MTNGRRLRPHFPGLGQRGDYSAAERHELALAFCVECLGWPDASRSGKYIFENKRRPELRHAHGKLHGFKFDPSDFGDVINGVREWCDIHGISLSLEYSPGSGKEAWRVRLAPQAESMCGDPCDVLLGACLAADRNIKQRDRSTLQTDLQRRNPAILDSPWGNIRENAQAALDFCSECLGWVGARVIDDFGYIYIRESVPKHLAETPIAPWERSFHFNENHIDRVVKAVSGWCDARAMGFVLEYFPSGSAGNCWRAAFGPLGEAHAEIASAALLAGCLAAHRRNAVCLTSNGA